MTECLHEELSRFFFTMKHDWGQTDSCLSLIKVRYLEKIIFYLHISKLNEWFDPMEALKYESK